MKDNEIQSDKLKVLELFGGIGAGTAALKNLGVDFEVVDYVDIDKYAVQSYNAINGTNYEPQDIRRWDKDIAADLVIHGSPCQDFSNAGSLAGGDEGSGTRSSLMWETVRIVCKLHPRVVLWENVKGVISKRNRHNFDKYLETMESLGYTNYYQVLNAKDFGVPQNRERVFTVSILEGSDFEFPKAEPCNNRVVEKNKSAVYQQDRIQDEDGLCRCISAGTHGNTLNLLKTVVREFVFPKEQPLTIRLKDVLEDEVDEKYYLSEEHEGVIKVRQATKKGYAEAYEGDGVDLSYPDSKTRRGRVGRGVANTITANTSMGAVQGMRIRRLTPKEVWRLMGRTDEDFEKAEKVCSNTQLYKQAGNFIVVPVIEAIFKQLLKGSD